MSEIGITNSEREIERVVEEKLETILLVRKVR